MSCCRACGRTGAYDLAFKAVREAIMRRLYGYAMAAALDEHNFDPEKGIEDLRPYARRYVREERQWPCLLTTREVVEILRDSCGEMALLADIMENEWKQTLAGSESD